MRLLPEEKDVYAAPLHNLYGMLPPLETSTPIVNA